MLPSFGLRRFPPTFEREIAKNLVKKLTKNQISQRPGGGKTRVEYLDMKTAINQANSIFTYKGWSSQVISLQSNFSEQTASGWRECFTATMRVTLQNGCFHEDVGVGEGERPRRADAIDQAQKSACSDGVKRCLKYFGDSLGNDLNPQKGNEPIPDNVVIGDETVFDALLGQIANLCSLITQQNSLNGYNNQFNNNNQNQNDNQNQNQNQFQNNSNQQNNNQQNQNQSNFNSNLNESSINQSNYQPNNQISNQISNQSKNNNHQSNNQPNTAGIIINVGPRNQVKFLNQEAVATPEKVKQEEEIKQTEPPKRIIIKGNRRQRQTQSPPNE
ncbi:DNA_repair protein RAD52 [Hexamita inflata]|uniref:DNA repair protein RAD52 n=1 Tax=Hexamita inflata TaxID=28002 RepID=A0AA86NN33_9EUKA|nr:DNA repair protein RAD52 [Hexamita inflata]